MFVCPASLSVCQVGGALVLIQPISVRYLTRWAGIPLELRGFPPLTDSARVRLEEERGEVTSG